jgi:hypothetical protein
MTEARNPQPNARPTEPEPAAAESALRTPQNAAELRDTIVTPPEAEPDQAPPERRSAAGRKAPGETTLVSVPTPADQIELELEERLLDCERRIRSLEDRLKLAEARAPGSAEPGWLVWVVFLLALAVAWQLFQGRN